MCAAKLYLISCLQGSMTFFRSSFDESDYQLRDSFLFGIIVVGNIIDNVASPKYLAICL